MAKILTLYTGPNCPLCDQAKALLYPLLQEAGWQLREVNIAADEHLQSLYGIRIPVVVNPNGAEKGWPFSAGQIRRLLEIN
ncbi:glutaredoxin family protein [Porticoccus sp.]